MLHVKLIQCFCFFRVPNFFQLKLSALLAVISCSIVKSSFLNRFPEPLKALKEKFSFF